MVKVELVKSLSRRTSISPLPLILRFKIHVQRKSQHFSVDVSYKRIMTETPLFVKLNNIIRIIVTVVNPIEGFFQYPPLFSTSTIRSTLQSDTGDLLSLKKLSYYVILFF